MRHAQKVLSSHPAVDDSAHERLIDCLEACDDGATACRACADACLSEEQQHRLVRCIRLNLDCAVICEATHAVLARGTVADFATLEAQLEACAAACDACATECERHAAGMEHCRACAQACRSCERACRELASGLLAGVSG